MNEIETVLRPWAFRDEPRDWDDVLRRAGLRRLGRRRTLALALAVAAALVAAPAFAFVHELRGLFAPGPPRVRLAADLHGPHGATGRLELEGRGMVLPRGAPRGDLVPFVPARGHRGRLDPRGILRWRLTTEHGARRAVIRGKRGGIVATLCAPCKPEAAGLIAPRIDAMVAMFGGRWTVEVSTRDGRLRGPVEPLRRR